MFFQDFSFISEVKALKPRAHLAAARLSQPPVTAVSPSCLFAFQTTQRFCFSGTGDSAHPRDRALGLAAQISASAADGLPCCQPGWALAGGHSGHVPHPGHVPRPRHGLSGRCSAAFDPFLQTLWCLWSILWWPAAPQPELPAQCPPGTRGLSPRPMAGHVPPAWRPSVLSTEVGGFIPCCLELRVPSPTGPPRHRTTE